MLTKAIIRNFKLFGEIELDLGDRVVLIGPNNSGKTSALQALALWDIGVKRWIEKRGSGKVPKERPGVTINRRDLIAVPVPGTKLLWRNLHVRNTTRGKGTQNLRIDIIVDGISKGHQWTCGLEFDYANEESFYCRPMSLSGGGRMEVPPEAAEQRIAYLPPMSGLSANEIKLDVGAVNVRLGEGRTAEVLRNLCLNIAEGENGNNRWQAIIKRIESLFGITLDFPEYIKERGEIVLTYRSAEKVKLDISSCGRGQQQTLLLLAHMTGNPGSVLLLDEPDAHLEILRQRQIYDMLTDVSTQTSSQIIAASHSEVILGEAASRDVVIAFVGRPHRIDDRGSQVVKALKELGFDQYYQAEQVGWVLYLEGSTDLAMLRAFAKLLDHPAKEPLERPFVHYVANQPRRAQEHFHGLREAKADLQGIAIYDRLESELPKDPYLEQSVWRRCEMENYLCSRDTLLAYAEKKGQKHGWGELSTSSWRNKMGEAIQEVEGALKSLRKPSPWGPDIKASDDFLDPLFEKFFDKVELPSLIKKTDYHELAQFVPKESIDPEIGEKLDLIVKISKQAQPRTD